VAGAALATGLVTLCLGGCALLQPPPVPQLPRLGVRGGGGAPMCAADISRAHAALAGAGAAAGDPAAVAAAHSAAAEAMSAYHACLAQPTRP
jgi:hypothetical protein